MPVSEEAQRHAAAVAARMAQRHARVLALGVFRHGDRILVAGGSDPVSGETYHRPLGGHVEFGETAAIALAREIAEELGAAITGIALLGVLESLFEYGGRPQHEIVFVFDAQFVDRARYDCDELPVTEAGAGWLPARWISLDTFASGAERLVPDGLLDLLRRADA